MRRAAWLIMEQYPLLGSFEPSFLVAAGELVWVAQSGKVADRAKSIRYFLRTGIVANVTD